MRAGRGDEERTERGGWMTRSDEGRGWGKERREREGEERGEWWTGERKEKGERSRRGLEKGGGRMGRGRHERRH